MTIHSLEVIDPERACVHHWKEVPWLAKPQKIEFKPGVNIIFGPNGSGKSTLIKAIAMMKHCDGIGLPVVTKDGIKDFKMGEFGMGKGIADGIILHCGYVSPDLTIGRWGMAGIDGDFGGEQIQQMFAKKTKGRASSGERGLEELVRIAFAKDVKVDYRIERENFLDKKLYDFAVQALQPSDNEGGTGVFLFDEIERSMDFANQALWWKQVRTAAMLQQIQMIFATHSPFALTFNEGDVNFIEPEPGYVERAREAMNNAGLMIRRA
jgi:predicted ATPase